MVNIFDGAHQFIDEQIQLGAEIEESDDHVNRTLELRREAVLRLDRLIEPGDPEDPLSVRAGELAETIVEAPWFHGALDWLLRATLQQHTAVEVFYEQEPGGSRLWMPFDFRAVEPERWHFEQVEREGDPLPRFKKRLSSYRDLLEPTPGKFVLHSISAFKGQRGRHARVRAIAKLWFLGRLALTEWGALIDSWFQPFTTVTYKAGLGEDEIQTIVDAYLELASRRIAAIPEGTTLTMHDVPHQTPHKDFQDFVRRGISVMLLGQDSSQQVKVGQETGATLQGEVRDDKRDGDAKLLDASLNRDLFGPWCLWNFGPGVKPPRIKHVIHESIDPAQRTTVFKGAQELGLPISMKQVYDDLSIEKPDDGDDLLVAPVQTVPVGGGFGFSRGRLQTGATEHQRDAGAAIRRPSNPQSVALARGEQRQAGAIEQAAGELAETIERDHLAKVRALGEQIERAVPETEGDPEKLLQLRDRLAALLGEIDPSETAATLEAGIMAAVGRGAEDVGVRASRPKLNLTRGRDARTPLVLSTARETFTSAVESFQQRTEIVTAERFNALADAARKRAWTMARVTDAGVLRDMHAAVGRAIESRDGFRSFLDDVLATMTQRGWIGPSASQARFVYDQNLGQAYSAGRFDQSRAAGVRAWRYLPSDRKVPRPEHKDFYGNLYKLGTGPMPPLDFGCNCGWEPVFEGEYDPNDVEGLDLPDDQSPTYKWRPSDFTRPVRLKRSDYPAEIVAELIALAKREADLVIEWV